MVIVKIVENRDIMRAIAQLDDLKEHCKEMSKDCNGDAESVIWDADIRAIELAIDIMKDKVMK